MSVIPMRNGVRNSMIISSIVWEIVPMISDLQFYKLPASIASGEYPLFSDSTDLTPYLIHTIKDVKISADLDQDRTVPTFEGYENASMVKTSAGWYWVVGVRTSTMYNDSIVVAMHYCASTSMIKSGDSIKGIWTRRSKALGYDVKVQQAVSNSPMTSNIKVQLPRMFAKTQFGINNVSDTESKIYWVQITSSNYIKNDQTVVKGHITRYGTFALNNDVTNSTLKYLAWDTSGDKNYIPAYPRIGDIINNIDTTLGIESSSVLDISVIPICPFEFESFDVVKTGPFVPGQPEPENEWVNQYTVLKNGNDKIKPWVGKDVSIDVGGLPGQTVTKTFKFRVYNLDLNINIEPISIEVNVPIEHEDLLTFTLSDMEINLGQFQIKNWEGNIVASLPIVSKTNTIYVNYISDSTGLYTLLQHVESKQHVIINSAKLPYLGSQWETYRVYSLDTDRKALEFAQEQYDKQFQMNMASAVFNGVVGAGLGAASGGSAGAIGAGVGAIGGLASGVASGILGKEMNDMKLRQDQQLTEMRLRASPATTFNTAYGLNQLDLMERFGGGIYTSLPANLTNDDFVKYIEEFGYPTEGVQTLTMTAGYYKGRILSQQNNKVFSGIKFERLQEEFNNGLKFVII